MVHSLCTRLFSLLQANNDQCSSRIIAQDSDSEAQMDNVTRTCIPCDTRILVTNNNNYRVLCADEKSENAPSRWSSPANWTRTSPESLDRVTSQTSVIHPCVRVRVALLSVLILVTLVTAVGLVVAFLLPVAEKRTISDSPIPPSTVSPSSPSPARTPDHEVQPSDREYKKRVSRLSWDLLNKRNPSSDANTNDAAETGIVLPSHMVFTSAKKPEPCDKPGQKPRSCRTVKYSQVISSEGCESVTIMNRKCLGSCVAVWVPGIFGSFPVCSPSRTTWKSLTLVCGQNRDKRKRVRVERVKRCSCMESQSTTPESTPTPALPLAPLL